MQKLNLLLYRSLLNDLLALEKWLALFHLISAVVFTVPEQALPIHRASKTPSAPSTKASRLLDVSPSWYLLQAPLAMPIGFDIAADRQLQVRLISVFDPSLWLDSQIGISPGLAPRLLLRPLHPSGRNSPLSTILNSKTVL